MNHNDFNNCIPTDDLILLEDEAEDEMLARALEESLRHCSEVEIPLRHSESRNGENESGSPGTSRDSAAFSSAVKLQMHSPSQPLLYKGKDAEGFDLSAGRSWIYPTNYPLRQYQYDIVSSCLFKNTLVSLPTGLGKTFIAAVVMYNFYRWFPRGKVIFMAPTKPLVHQQIEACYKVMGIPKEDTAEMTGSMSPGERAVAWEMKRVFFLTPQVLTNDLTCGQCPAASIKCVVVDEAHKALGNHSYCQVMKALWPFNNKFRVLALSATPGSDMQAVKQVVRNLMISHVELRNEASPDVAVFTHKRRVETIVVSLGTYLSSVKERFMLILDRYLSFLRKHKALCGSMKEHTKFGVLKARDTFRQNPPSGIPRGQFGIIEANFAVYITLLHSLELLSLYGLRSFLKFLQGVLHENRGKAVVHTYLKNDGELEKLLDELREKVGPDNQAEPEPDQSMAVPPSGLESMACVYSHPKVEKVQDIVVGHFRSFQVKNIVTRAMIFCQYRDIVIEVYQILRRHHPLVKPMTFVGQSSAGKQSKGFTQKQQLKVMRKFKAGGYNTLISTCVGEEGLDIGEVDLIVCFDAHKSPVRLVQRMGRTGRQREGRIVMLVTEGKEHDKFKASMYQNQTMTKKLLEGNHIAVHMYENNPRMIPPGIEPQCHRMFMTVCTTEETQVKKVKQRNQDIRKLLVNPSGTKVMGLRVNEGSSPYCTEDELVKFWDGKSVTVPAFDRFRDVEELHGKEGRELCEAFNKDFVACKHGDSRKFDLGKWLQWQQTLQPAVLVEHTDDSRMLSELLQYAENKQCQMVPTQTTGLLSQVNTSLLWPRKKSKGRRLLKQSATSSVSEPKMCGKKDEVAAVSVSNAKENSASYHLQPEAAVISSRSPLLQTTAEIVDIETDEKLSNTVLIEIPNDQNNIAATAEQKAVSPKKDLTNDDLCYFCKNALFYCHHIVSCISTIENNRAENKCYKSLDLCALNNFTEANVIAFDLKQLLSPFEDHNVDTSVEEGKISSYHDYEHASEVKSQKDERDMKLNFNLDFSVFEHYLLGEEMLPENPTGNFKSEMAVSKVDHHITDVNVGPGNIRSNSAFPKIESPVQPEREIKPMQESFSSVSLGRLSNTEHTPKRSRQMETDFSHKETPSNLLLSSVSPIFGSVLKKHTPESPVLGSVLKNISHNSTRTFPVCSTPKVHKKTLFSGNVVLDTVQEKGGDFTLGSTQNLKVKGDGSLNTHTFHGCEEPLNSPVPEVQALPRPNFDLLSAAQDIGILKPGFKNVRNADSFTNSTMYTVTQMLDLVDKELNIVDVAEPVKICRSVQDTVPCTFTESRVAEGISGKGDKCSDTVNHGSMSNITSLVRNSTKTITSSLSSHTVQNTPIHCEQKSKQTHSYLHDSDDDVFVNLDLDHNMFTKCKQNTSVISEVHTVDNSMEVDTDLLANGDRSQHEIGDDIGKQEFDTEVPSLMSAAPQITKVSKYSTVGHNQVTAAVSKPSLSCLSLKHKEKDSAKITCTGNSLKTMGSKPNISSIDPKTNYDEESLSNIIGDVTVGAAVKQKEINRSIYSDGQLDWCISLNNQKTVPYGSSVASICKASSGDDSLVLKPLVRNRKTNISSTSNESRDLSSYSTKSRIIRHERIKKSKSLPVEDSLWLTARKSNLDTLTSSSSSSSDSPQLITDVKKHNSSTGNKSVVKNDGAISSEDDSYFQSPSLVRLKKRNQSKSAVKTDRYKCRRKSTPVNKKPKHGLPHCAFVESEAEESGSCLSSFDDEDTSGLDNYDSSFVSDSGDQTHTDIQAKFLHSLIRSPGSRQGHFKMPAYKPPVPLEDVFSQVEAEFETSYLEDSFCVNEEPHSEKMESSVLEEAEAILEAKSKWKRKRRKRMRSSSASDYGEGTSGNNIKYDASRSKKRRLRIVTIESSDSESSSQAVNKISVVVEVHHQKEIPVPSPKIHAETVNNAGISDVGKSETEFVYKKSISCGVLGKSPVSTKQSVCKTETAAVTDELNWSDWNFDSLELSSFKEVFVKKENRKSVITCNINESKGAECLSVGEEGMIPPVLTCSRKLVSKAVRSLSAEFDKEAVPTAISGDSDTRQLAFVGADNSVLSAPGSSIAALSQEQQFKVLRTTVLETFYELVPTSQDLPRQ
ncbi:uncharacterized protein LOC111862417 isoform X3 [Cryptotermes secundus]|uniref:uncharacterized protein LOC111862417 isoform X3 n=1 Tax=Cryptotermes secundus TaxID=105785 RepID=UPI000CD7D15B|nr:uncharacterized protein LOC111862417 isoform X3 [Cryptotermes secundus]